MRDWAYQAMHDVAMALPPSDFGSHRACEAAAELLRQERDRADEILAALKKMVAEAQAIDRPGALAFRDARAVIAKAEGR